MDELLKYFMTETDRRLGGIEEKLDDLTKFKAEMIATARLTSLMVSGVCGFITLVVTVFVTWAATKR